MANQQGPSSGTRGGSSEQHAEAGRQSNKNEQSSGSQREPMSGTPGSTSGTSGSSGGSR